MRPLTLLAFGGVSATVIGAVVLVLWTMGSSASAREPFTTMELAPRDVELYVALNTEPSSSQWMAFADLLDTVDVEDPLRDGWNELLSEQDLTWDNDIVSLLGDEGYAAITDFSSLDDGQGFVGAFELRDPGEAEELFLRLVTEAAEDEGEELLSEDYQGTTIHYMEGDLGDFFGGDEYYDEEDISGDFEDFGEGIIEEDGQQPGNDEPSQEEPQIQDTGAIAFAEGAVVIGLSRADVQGGLDVLQGRAPSAIENTRLQEMRARQVEDFLLWGYVDLAEAWDALDETLQENTDDPEEAREYERTLEEARESADRMSFTMAARGDSFVIDALTLQPPGAPPNTEYLLDTPFDTEYASQVPEDTLAFAAGYDLYGEVYEPLYDAVKDIKTGSAYCSDSFDVSYYFPSEYDERDDPVYGQFYDEEGNFDDAAYEAWDEALMAFFTQPDGSLDWEAYDAHLDSLYEEACAADTKTVAEEIEEFEEDVGFDLEEDFLGLMTGEFAVAFNAANFDADEPDIEVLGMLDIADPGRMRSSLDKLAGYLEREEGFTIEQPDASGVQRFTDEDGSSSDTVAWAVADGSFLVSYPDGPTVDFVEGVAGPSLAESDNWQQVMALLPQEKTFVGYLNLARVVEELESVEDVQQELDDLTTGEVTLEDLRPIRSIGLATSNVEGGWAVRIALLIDE